MSKGGRRVRIFSALEVANICGVVNQTTINWIKNGYLKAFTTPGGQYRIYAKDLAAFLDKRGMSVSGKALSEMMENTNWNSFMIAAGQPLNEKLKAQTERLLPGYMIIQAFDWFEIGRKFVEEKPGLVLLDAELPGADVSRFVQTVKEDFLFGYPFVILLTDGNFPSAHNAPESKHAVPDLVFSKPLDLNKFENAIKNLEKHRLALPLQSLAEAII